LPISDWTEFSEALFNRQLAIGNRKSSRSFFASFTRTGLKRPFALAQLSTCGTALKGTLIGTQARSPINGQDTFNFCMGTRNNVNANQFANSAGGGRSRVRCCLDCAHISAHENSHVAGPDIFFSQELDIRSLDHCVSSFDRANEAFGLHHSECF
jgi:hypothetical protein